MIVIQPQDWNSQALEAVLDDIEYYIVLDWNQFGNYWTMAIRNSAYATLIDGISMVTNYPLLWQFKYASMPPGELYVMTSSFQSGPIPRDGFMTTKYWLAYRTRQDILTERWV